MQNNGKLKPVRYCLEKPEKIQKSLSKYLSQKINSFMMAKSDSSIESYMQNTQNSGDIDLNDSLLQNRSEGKSALKVLLITLSLSDRMN
jgi:hypothetical protein